MQSRVPLGPGKFHVVVLVLVYDEGNDNVADDRKACAVRDVLTVGSASA